MRYIALLKIFILFFICTYGQTSFLKTYPGSSSIYRPNTIIQTLDSCYILQSIILANQPSNLMKLDQEGEIVWKKGYSADGNAFSGHDVIQTKDTGFALVGNIFVPGRFNDICLVKTDDTGGVEWMKLYGTTKHDGIINVAIGTDSRRTRVYETTDGGYIIASITSGYGTRESAYVLRVDGMGTLQWSRVFKRSSTSDDYCIALVVNEDGTFTMVSNYFDLGADWGISMWKLNSNGTVIWQENYKINTVSSNNPRSGNIVKASDGGYIFNGARILPKNSYVIKTDSLGNIQWTKTHNTGNIDCPMYLNQTSDGGIVVTTKELNYSAGVGSVMYKLDANGELQWSKGYAPSLDTWGDIVIETKDGGLLMSAVDRSNPNQGALLVKTDANGETHCEHHDVPLTEDTLAYSLSLGQLTTTLATGEFNPVSSISIPMVWIDDDCPIDVTIDWLSSDYLCYGDSGLAIARASGGMMPYSYSWSPSGDTTDTVFLDVGMHIVTITDASSDTARDTIFISGADTSFSVAITPNNLISCYGLDTTLMVSFEEGIPSGSLDSLIFIWNSDTQSIAFSFTIESDTIFFVDAFDSIGCKASDSIIINVIDSITLPQDTLVNACIGEDLQLKVNTAENLDWQVSVGNIDTSEMPTIKITESSTFFAYASNECFGDTLTYEVIAESCEMTYFIPNAFSPDQDNENFSFGALATNIASYNIKIYSNRGNLIFESSSLDQKWDGTRKNKQMPDGVYTYQVILQSKLGETIYEQGTVTLVR